MKFQKILIGIDDSKHSEHAAEYGFDLAHTYQSAVALVHIVEPMVMPASTDLNMMGTFVPSFGVEEMEVVNIQEESSKKLLSDTIARLAGDLEITQYNEIGSTAESIVACAIEFKADLIVIGTHSRTGLDRLLMGNVAEHVLRHSPVPVLVIPMLEEAVTE